MAQRVYHSAAIVFLMAVGDGDSFIIRSPSETLFAHQRTRQIKSTAFEMMCFDGIDQSLQFQLDKLPLSMPESNIFSTTSQLASDPVFEAELLNDFSHVVLDFTTFVSPNTAWIRFFNVLGRVLIIVADYVPDRYISPDEAFFQAFLLIVSTHMFLKSAYPVMASSSTSLSVRDRRAFTQLFSVVDLSVLQFKTLLASQTLAWVELKHKERVDLNDDCIYWLHSGDITITQSLDYTVTSRGKLSDRLFGELFLAKALEESMLKESPCKKKPKSNKTKSSSSSATVETLVAGPNGSTLLRISTPKLLQAMNHDDQLSDSINRLILLCMQEKLSQTFQRGHWKTPDVIDSQDICI
jgi:hypothetical protein